MSFLVSVQDPARVDPEVEAGDVAGIVGREIGDSARDVLGFDPGDRRNGRAEDRCPYGVVPVTPVVPGFSVSEKATTSPRLRGEDVV
ncbi:hypothetical protein GORHZ_183_00040 [Gordonia rhizosphera NBRC 16068]|uniref:Uncharacterized protein n=1 Tax=Gordonia rhizosphera NBRC 16068 TaxID=1108045 RepID=K6W055_9ACTN|nr:hypothetical protein GORHZ_183_00040 [Gordonia rhizosphera NBRC 16068]